MTTVTLSDDGTMTKVSFPYDAEAVALLKDSVPGWDRRFDPATKSWVVGKAWRPKLTEALTRAGHQVRDAADPPPKPTHYSQGIGGFFGVDDEVEGFDIKGAAQAFVDSIPVAHRGKAFRAVAKLLYPDLYRGRR